MRTLWRSHSHAMIYPLYIHYIMVHVTASYEIGKKKKQSEQNQKITLRWIWLDWIGLYHNEPFRRIVYVGVSIVLNQMDFFFRFCAQNGHIYIFRLLKYGTFIYSTNSWLAELSWPFIRFFIESIQQTVRIWQ